VVQGEKICCVFVLYSFFDLPTSYAHKSKSQQEIPNVFVWVPTLALVGGFGVQKALTDGFLKENGWLPETESMTQEEKNQYLFKHSHFNNRTLG
jgi:hypothetical protein